jgi:hypothetical protein
MMSRTFFAALFILVGTLGCEKSPDATVEPSPAPHAEIPKKPSVEKDPALKKEPALSEEEAFVSRLERAEYRRGMEDKVHQALKGDHLTHRAWAATWLGRHGTAKSVPLLIDALSDESLHVGGNYSDPGMSTTRHRAKLALNKLVGEDFGYVWNGPVAERKAAIAKWKAWLKERDAVIAVIRTWLKKEGMTQYDVYRVHLNGDKTEWGASLTEKNPRPGAPVLRVDRKTHAIRLIKGR